MLYPQANGARFLISECFVSANLGKVQNTRNVCTQRVSYEDRLKRLLFCHLSYLYFTFGDEGGKINCYYDFKGSITGFYDDSLEKIRRLADTTID